jgi:hypothetical protein
MSTSASHKAQRYTRPEAEAHAAGPPATVAGVLPVVREADAAIDHRIGDVFDGLVHRPRPPFHQIERVSDRTRGLDRDHADCLVDGVAVVLRCLSHARTVRLLEEFPAFAAKSGVFDGSP